MATHPRPFLAVRQRQPTAGSPRRPPGCRALRGLGRLDVFPPGDVGAQAGLRALMHLPAEAPLDRIIERFGEYRGYLYFYALGGQLLAKGLIRS